MSGRATVSHDVILVGGGLQNGLVALALLARRPGLRLAVVDPAPTLGGNHTWSFHATDLVAPLADEVEPLVVARWSEHEVRFPALARVVREPYRAITSERFHEVLSARLAGAPHASWWRARAVEVAPGGVRLDDGTGLEAPLVVDARGPAAAPVTTAGWQKFVGLELELDGDRGGPAPHPRPLLMDATVEQLGGFRFLYVLPLAPGRVLVEDTVYAGGPELDRQAVAARARAWAEAAGYAVAGVRRVEHGCLPIPLADESVAPPVDLGPRGVVVRGGVHGGWFHPTTGYSFPVAARLAAMLAETGPAPAEVVAGVTALWAAHRRQARFARLLNRLLFRHVAPAERWNVLARFYRLPDATIRRFYALELTTADRARIVCGRPPRGFGLRPRFSQEVS
jgi:lycopene beta-cyclase